MTTNPRHSLARNNEPIFDDGEIDPQATFGNLLGYAFEHADTVPGASLAELMKRHATDDMEIAGDIAEDDSSGAQRLIQRARHWLMICEELEERTLEVEGTISLPEPGQPAEVYIVPFDTHGEPDFASARRAKNEEMTRLGWVSRENACDAISAMFGGDRRPVVPVDLESVPS